MKKLLLLAMVMSIVSPSKTYPTTLIVTDVNGYEVTAVTATGIEYRFDGDDYDVGDFVACIMDDNNTPDIHDDKIIRTRYAGYAELFERSVTA